MARHQVSSCPPVLIELLLRCIRCPVKQPSADGDAENTQQQAPTTSLRQCNESLSLFVPAAQARLHVCFATAESSVMRPRTLWKHRPVKQAQEVFEEFRDGLEVGRVHL